MKENWETKVWEVKMRRRSEEEARGGGSIYSADDQRADAYV